MAAQPNHIFNRFTRESGLTSSTIQDMKQDGDGSLWLASWGGLYRFDGDRFTNYRTDIPDDRGNPRSNRFTNIEKDAAGRLWTLAYDNSLYRIDTGRARLEPAEIPGHSIDSIGGLPDGRIYLLARDNTVLLQGPSEDSGAGSEFSPIAVLPADSSLHGIYEDSSRQLWLMTDRGLYLEGRQVGTEPAFCALERNGKLYFGTTGGGILLQDGDTVRRMQTRLSADIRLLAELPDPGEILVGTLDEGFFIYRPDRSVLTSAGSCSYPVGKLQAIRGDGRLWIYSESGGLDWYDPGLKRLVPFFNTDIQQGWNHENRIACVLQDAQGNLWISSYSGGLEEVVFLQDRFHFRPLAQTDSVSPAGSVRALHEYGDGELLSATRDGKIHLLDSGLAARRQIGLGTSAYSLFRDGDGTIWAGTRGGGLAEIPAQNRNPGGQVRFHRRSDSYYGANADEIFCLREGPRRRLWIGSFDDGLSYLDLADPARNFISKKNRLTFPTEERNRIRCIEFDEAGNLYAGGTIGLFVCGNPEAEPEEMHFVPFSRVHNYDIQDIVASSRSGLYACSYGSGFLAFDSRDPSSGFRAYTVDDGMLSNFILSAAEDDSGNIWIATEGGLNRLSPFTGSLIGYSYERLGFPMRFNEGSILRASDGRLFFNTNSGIFYFDPEEISNSSYVPPLQIRACHSGHRSFDADGGPVRLRAGEQLSLEFIAIDMTGPGHILYSWRLDGTEEDWTSLGREHLLHLGPFRQGRHTLYLRSTNGDGVPVDNLRRVEISVAPPLPLSRGAIALYLLLGLAAGLRLLPRRKQAGAGTAAPEHPCLAGLQGDDRRLVGSLLDLLSERLDDGALDMDAIAEAMSMSRSALFKKTKALTGRTPMDLLRELRFTRAQELIASDGYSISQVAYMTGFNDAHYFSKVFKKQCGMTPSEYREAMASNPPAGGRKRPAA